VLAGRAAGDSERPGPGLRLRAGHGDALRASWGRRPSGSRVIGPSAQAVTARPGPRPPPLAGPAAA